MFAMHATFVVCAFVGKCFSIQHKHFAFPLLRNPRVGGCCSLFNLQHGMINPYGPYDFFERMGLIQFKQKRMKFELVPVLWFLVVSSYFQPPEGDDVSLQEICICHRVLSRTLSQRRPSRWVWFDFLQNTVWEFDLLDGNIM